MCDMQRGNLRPVVEKLLRLLAPKQFKPLEAEQVRAAPRIGANQNGLAHP